MAISKDISPAEFIEYIKQWYLNKPDFFVQQYQQDFILNIQDMQRAERLRQLEKQERHWRNYGLRGLNWYGTEIGRLTCTKHNFFIIDDFEDTRDTHSEWRDLNEDYKPR